MAQDSPIDVDKLVSDQRVVDEINRHLWIESEKAGYDIGFEAAKNDWLKRFAQAWVEYHMPKAQAKERRIDSIEQIYEAQAHQMESQPRKRRAKSYI